jgi:hypothetical protein
MHDGALELRVDGAVHYVMVASGSPVRGFFSDSRPGDVKAHVKALVDPHGAAAKPLVRLWPRAEALPAQASPALIQAYRDLVAALIARFEQGGTANAAELVEAARRQQVAKFPLLERFSPSMPTVRDPVTDTATLTSAVAAWLADALRVLSASGLAPEAALKELTTARRHMFNAAGLFDALPWKPQW